MRRTAKYNAGVTMLRSLGIRPKRENADVYNQLEREGYWWKQKSGVWTNEKQPSTTIFADDDGNATNICKIRLMAHPDKMRELLSVLKATDGLTVIEVSEKEYENRNNSAGIRVYVTGVLND